MKNIIRIVIFVLLLISFNVLNGQKYIIGGKYEDIKRLDVKILKSSRYNISLVESDCDYLKKLLKEGNIQYFEPVAIAKAFFIPNDYYYSHQWNFNMLGMEDVWDLTMGVDNVKVSILDTGVGFEYYQIPSSEQGEVISGDGHYHKADDLNSATFLSGYDYIHNDSHPNDQNGHGTHIAGTIAQATNNGIGVAGMAPNVSIIPIQVLDYKGEGDSYTIAEGIYYACDQGANVINMSLGGAPGDSNGWHTVHNAIIHACSLNIAVVIASGNDGIGELSYPSAFKEVFSCGAVGYNQQKTSYSQYGSGLDFVMPGGEGSNKILQETFRGYYDGHYSRVDSFAYYYYYGTSMATPHLAAAIALLKSYGITNLDEIYGRLAYYAIDKGENGYDTLYGFGIPNILNALNSTYSDNTPPVFNIYLAENPVFNGNINVWTATNEELQNGMPDSIKVKRGGEIQKYTPVIISHNIYKSSFSFNTDGEYEISVYGKDIWGNYSTSTKLFNLFYIPVKMEKNIKISAYQFSFLENTFPNECIIQLYCNKDGFNIEMPSIINNPVKLNVKLKNIYIIGPDNQLVSYSLDKGIRLYNIEHSGYYRIVWNIKTYNSGSGTILESCEPLNGILSIYSLDGRLIESNHLINRKRVCINSISKGVYFIKLKTNGMLLKRKISIW